MFRIEEGKFLKSSRCFHPRNFPETPRSRSHPHRTLARLPDSPLTPSYTPPGPAAASAPPGRLLPTQPRHGRRSSKQVTWPRCARERVEARRSGEPYRAPWWSWSAEVEAIAPLRVLSFPPTPPYHHEMCQEVTDRKRIHRVDMTRGGRGFATMTS